MVKIRRLFVENFIILKEVMGKDRIELFFSDNLLCIIIGKNGSGKSFLMSLLTPAPIDHVRNRTSFPGLPNKEAVKEIDIEIDYKYLYKCKIIYNKNKTSCFISKTNILNPDEPIVELNPSGNVNSYYEVLSKEFGWSKNYINIGFLSSGVTNLIMMKSAERSDYMTEWLPQLSEYIDAHKIVSKKANAIKRQIDMLNNDIGKLSGTDYDVLINNYNNNIIELNKKYISYLDYKSKLDTYNSLYPNIDKNQMDIRLSDLKRMASLLSNERIEIINCGKLINEYSGEKGKKLLDNNIKDCESKLSLLSEKLSSSGDSLLSIQSEMDEIKSNNEINSEQNIIDIEASLNSVTAELEDLTKTKEIILKRNPDYIEVDNISKNTIDLFISFIEDLSDMRNTITSLVDSSILKDSNVLSQISDQNTSLEEAYEDRMTKLDIQIMKISNKIYSLKNSNMTKELLDLRPSACVVSCGIVDEIIKYINPEEEIKKLQGELANLINEKTEINGNKEKLLKEKQNILLALNYINEINQRAMRQKDLISLFPNTIKSYFENPDTCALMNAIPFINDKIINYRDYIYLNEKIKVSNGVMYTTSVTYKMMKQQKNIADKWLKLHEKHQEISKKRNSLIDDFDKTKETEKRLKSIDLIREQNDKDIKNYNNKTDNLNKEKKVLTNNCKNYYLKESIKYSMKKLELAIYKVKNELDEYNEKLDIIKNKKNSMQTLIDSRDLLIERKKRYDILSDIWSPKTGYPSWEMEEFLDALTIQTNKDLEKMWGSDLKIESFNIGANEFSIPINRNGVIINDANECSDGERATLSLAISFAIIEINLRHKKYNVLRFDEIDGPLDSERRRTFLDMVLDRLSSLDCGNLFTITHNNEFADVEADLIVLQDADESNINLSNKNIIYHY